MPSLYFKITFEKHADLLLISNVKISHYVLIKDLNRFMTKKKSIAVKKQFYRYCLQCIISGTKNLVIHAKISLAISHTKSVTLYE